MRTFLAALAAFLLLAPAAQARTYGATTLELDPGAVAALTGLGVAPAPIAPATATSAGELAFPITNKPFGALLSGTIRHSGGIALTAGGDDGEARELLHRPAAAAAHRARRWPARADPVARLLARPDRLGGTLKVGRSADR